MPTSSPPTQRVVAIMSTVAAAPTQAFTVAELVRATGASRATAHAIITQLVHQGWLHRGPDGKVGVGHTFTSLGLQAGAAHPLTARARPHLAALAELLRCPAFLAEPEGDAIVLTDHIVPAGVTDAGKGPRLGDAVPLRAPYAREFVAWRTDIDGWWGANDGDAAGRDERTRRRLRAVLAAIRRRGYGVERFDDETLQVLRTLEGESTGLSESVTRRVAEALAEHSQIDVLDGELADGELYAALTIAAPVFDPSGSVTATLVVAPQRRLSGREIRHHGESAARAADVLTNGLGGRRPAD